MTYVTAGFPTPADTVDILLGMEAGGAGNDPSSKICLGSYSHIDVIEIGLPFTDPIADGPTVQKANTVRIRSSFSTCDLDTHISRSKPSKMGLQLLPRLRWYDKLERRD